MFFDPARSSSPCPQEPDEQKACALAQLRLTGVSKTLKIACSGLLLTLPLDFRLVTFSLAITALVLAVGLLVGGRIQFAFFPSVDGDTIRANVQFSSGTPASEVAAYLVQVEDALLDTEAELGGNMISERISYFGTNKLPTAGISSTEQVALLEGGA